MMHCPICSAVVNDQVEHCPQCGFNLRLGPPAGQEPRPKKRVRLPEPDPAPERAKVAEPMQSTGEPSSPAEKGTILTRCERCSETGVDAIFRCRERALGGCPWQEERHSNRVRNTQEPLGKVGAALIIGGGRLLGVRWEQLLHSASGSRLQRTTLWGRELQRQFTTAPELVQIDLSLDKPLQYPPSVAALATRKAVSVVRAAVIGLLTDRKVDPLVYHTYRLGPDGASKRSHSTYLFKRFHPPGEDRIARSWLETQFLGWSAEGRPIEKIVHRILVKDRSDPGRWLLKRVQDYAVRRGWGRWKFPAFLKRFETDPEHYESLALERKVLEQLSRALAEAQPALSRALDEGIRKGIASRTKQSDPC